MEQTTWIWLEVVNIALNSGGGQQRIEVQLKGDQDDKRWLPCTADPEAFKSLMEAMKDKRPVHAMLTATAKATLEIQELRIAFSASQTRM